TSENSIGLVHHGSISSDVDCILKSSFCNLWSLHNSMLNHRLHNFSYINFGSTTCVFIHLHEVISDFTVVPLEGCAHTKYIFINPLRNMCFNKLSWSQSLRY